MTKCCVCFKTLTPSNTLGGFMGWFCRLFGIGRGWEKFKTCQKCRDYSAFGFTIEEIRLYGE